MNPIKSLLALATFTALIGCGASDPSEVSIPTYSAPTDAICDNATQDVDWEKILQANASSFSEYKLFQSQCNPTANANERGLAYDLSIPLFSDYTSKYRFVFIPPGEKANYIEGEVFDFPLGTAITKTFSMPSTTEKDSRGYSIENIIETRILVKQANGWVARVYTWNDDKLDATREREGATVATVLGHGEEIIQFNYGVPTQAACTECHKFKNDDGTAFFTPIGPKARYLNSDYDYGTGPENQIEKWISEGILDNTNVPAAGDREQAKVFNDYVDVDSIPPSELEDFTMGWLDINCAHCHREEGTAGNTAFKVAANAVFQGYCEVPVSGAGTGALVVLPGNADSSLIYQRLNTTDAGFAMPPIGRSAIHVEGTALVKRWIDSLVTPNCN